MISSLNQYQCARQQATLLLYIVIYIIEPAITCSINNHDNVILLVDVAKTPMQACEWPPVPKEKNYHYSLVR